MKRCFVLLVVLSVMSFGCATMSPDAINLPVFDKFYYVIFEGKPEIVSDKVYCCNNLEIGKVLEQQPGSNNLYVARISIVQKFNDMMKDNVVFYITDGKMTYETLSDTGKPLSEGAKLIGFTGKTFLYGFKLKNAMKNISETLIHDAQVLYDKATTTK